MTDEFEDLPDKLKRYIESNTQTLEPLTPADGVEQFLTHKKTEIRPQTVDEYRGKLEHVLDYCDQNGIENLNDLTGRDIKDFAWYRREETGSQDGSLSAKTIRDDMYLLRDLLRYLGDIEAVPRDLYRKIDIPSLDDQDGVRDIHLERDRVEMILQHLRKYEYGSKEHATWKFFTDTGRRPGDLFALDLGDLYLEIDNPYIKLVHREGETELKNGENGETEISISSETAQAFKAYIEKKRIDVTTENGREPFLTSQYGRLSKMSIRKYVYQYSCPCVVTNECPHDRDISSCEAAQKVNQAYQCPSSEPPYALRHGYITAKRNDGVPIDVLTERCDASEPVIDKHYDERTEEEKRELRRQILEQVENERDTGGGYA